MKRFVRIVVITLLLLTGINALVAGFLFMLDPSGAKMGMSPEYLIHSPFQTFLIPGIVLFTVNGVMNVIASVLLLKNNKNAVLFTGFQGLMLIGWIVVQVLMVKDVNPLHIIMFSIGLLLISGAIVLRRTIS